MMVYSVNGWHGCGGVSCKGTSHKKEESTRTRYPKQRATKWGHLHSGGEVAHKPILRREGTTTRVTHRKGWSESIGSVIYSKAKRMLENE
jgi:hypothetical protein